jgi:hypothetical protein
MLESSSEDGGQEIPEIFFSTEVVLKKELLSYRTK